ncbi:MAG: hypothetical protein JXJ04_23830 [Spirochaetales bacterium]|nr:hypothetical protein [Spirochaetales bacterium]
MNDIVQDIQLIDRFKEEMGGVFTLPDLKNIFSLPYDNRFYRRIHNLIELGILFSYIRGIYITPDCKIDFLSQKICYTSYISFETILAKKLMIGTVPRNEIRAVKTGKKRVYDTNGILITHLGIQKDLYFGFKTIGGVNYALPEKALLDTLYYYCKGQKFYFDIYSDIDISLLKRTVIEGYLEKYKNPLFKDFVRNYLHENTISR